MDFLKICTQSSFALSLSRSPVMRTSISTISIYLTLQYFMDNLQIQLVNLFFFSFHLSLYFYLTHACDLCDRHHLAVFVIYLISFSADIYFEIQSIELIYRNRMNWWTIFVVCQFCVVDDDILSLFFLSSLFSNEDKCGDLFWKLGNSLDVVCAHVLLRDPITIFYLLIYR